MNVRGYAGGLALLSFLVLSVTGIILMFHYRPVEEYAYLDMKSLQFDVPFGMFLRNMHRWAAHGMVILVLVHMFRVFLSGNYKSPQGFNWAVGVVLLVLTFLMSGTGYVLPWDQPSFESVAIFVRPTLLPFYVFHCLVLPAVATGLMIVHVRKATESKEGFPLKAGLVLLILLMVCSILFDAPLEEATNLSVTRNPSKAPWYFLGLQEMQVYFDPWIASVVLPCLIIVGLILIPYLDVNKKEVGHDSIRERKFAVSVFCFGFFILWLLPILVGLFLRGPGWNLYMPWEEWDPGKVVAANPVDLNLFLSQRLGLDFLRNEVVGALLGLVIIGLYYSLGVVFYRWKGRRSATVRELGAVRYAVVAFLFLTMMALPIRMILRWTLHIKSVVTLPWIGLNI